MVVASYDLAYAGVSTDIQISSLAGAKEGRVLDITGRPMKTGGTLVFASANITKVKDGKSEFVATGVHTKYLHR